MALPATTYTLTILTTAPQESEGLSIPKKSTINITESIPSCQPFLVNLW